MKNKTISAMTQWRHSIHQHPELAYQETRTAQLVADILIDLGMEVHQGIASTGVVGVLQSSASNAPKVALRADMDALPIQEQNDFSYASKHDNVMHACGHDGHTAMLLGAARELAKEESLNCTVYFIFQPAEENEAGARRMIEEGLFDRFPADAVFALHNMPGLPVGHIATRPGAMMAAFSTFECRILGRAAHSSTPHQGVDSIEVACQLAQQWQGLGRRHYGADEQALIAVTQIQGGTASNVIADEVVLKGSTRCLTTETQKTLAKTMRETAELVARSYGALCEFSFEERYPVLVNEPKCTKFGISVANSSVGIAHSDSECSAIWGSEDFAFMLQHCPGAYFLLGNGGDEQGGCHQLHHPNYDFNDAILPIGAKFWVDLVKQFSQFDSLIDE
ncbi:M20 aminoacylase family protein [uncultured Pseudoteredinibacter sp.]|uniref:M20 aminoacylase family protein n=1 Tax=uncultured Pseudoteredinibacter sp. TaxID=1641701 RepID=UPI00260562AF|nr:M20 aminoacylase family protein [uncultured Pseudoteredinibacter sp.]